MNVLVVGGNSFFGRNLVHQLVAESNNVWVLNRGNTANVDHPRITHLKTDRKNLDVIVDCINTNKIDIIYDQICFTASDAKDWLEVFSRCKGIIPRLIHTSTQSVYKSGIALSEDVFDPYTYTYQSEITTEEDYGEAKRQAEAVLFQSEFKDNIIAVRFPIVIAADDKTKRFQYHVEALKEGKEVFVPNLEAYISFISSTDAAKVLKRLAILNCRGPVNACAHRPIKLANFFHLIENYYSKSFRFGDDPHKNYSPYGIGRDWWMDTDKLKDLGIYTKEITEVVVEELNKLENRTENTDLQKAL